jgi:hypothetical protein
MKKSSPLAINDTPDQEDENRDLLDGRSTVGCLFLGIFILLIIGGLLCKCTDLIRNAQ